MATLKWEAEMVIRHPTYIFELQQCLYVKEINIEK